MNVNTALGIGNLPAPATLAHTAGPSCRRGCCWTPYPVCARNWTCTCHRGEHQ